MSEDPLAAFYPSGGIPDREQILGNSNTVSDPQVDAEKEKQGFIQVTDVHIEGIQDTESLYEEEFQNSAPASNQNTTTHEINMEKQKKYNIDVKDWISKRGQLKLQKIDQYEIILNQNDKIEKKCQGRNLSNLPSMSDNQDAFEKLKAIVDQHKKRFMADSEIVKPRVENQKQSQDTLKKGIFGSHIIKSEFSDDLRGKQLDPWDSKNKYDSYIVEDPKQVLEKSIKESLEELQKLNQEIDLFTKFNGEIFNKIIEFNKRYQESLLKPINKPKRSGLNK